MKKRDRSIRVLIKEPGKDFRTEYIDLTYDNYEKLLGATLKETYQMQVLACKNALVLFSYNSNVENCKVFDTVFNGTILFVGEKWRGEYCDLSSQDDALIRKFTRTPDDYKVKSTKIRGCYAWEV